MGYKPFSRKQLEVLTWWHRQSRHHGRDAVICDGAVRSGKTLCLSLSFVAWAMSAFDGADFALCGKTVTSLSRNLVAPLLPLLQEAGLACRYLVSKGRLEVSCMGRQNRFHLFGGRDESSAALIQGITLSGVLLDEVALMPRSFVEQALARCSVAGSRFWFSCNPEHPLHWFYQEWIRKAEEKNALYLHFTMADNPSLTPEIRRRYEGLYAGVFYQRFVLGRWTAPSGLVYPMFSPQRHLAQPPAPPEEWYVSCDYGTVNPCSMGLWGRVGQVWYRAAEYYHDSRRTGVMRTDEEYYRALEALAGERPLAGVVVDPSAASFLECVRRHGRYTAIQARNQVADGIRLVSDALKSGRILIGPDCRDAIREFGLYRWKEQSAQDAPVKEDDHAMDDIRYFVSTVLDREQPAGAFAAVVRPPVSFCGAGGPTLAAGGKGVRL